MAPKYINSIFWQVSNSGEIIAQTTSAAQLEFAFDPVEDNPALQGTELSCRVTLTRRATLALGFQVVLIGTCMDASHAMLLHFYL